MDAANTRLNVTISIFSATPTLMSLTLHQSTPPLWQMSLFNVVQQNVLSKLVIWQVFHLRQISVLTKIWLHNRHGFF